MKLLFDENLSYKLCTRLADLFPGSSQVRIASIDQVLDRTIWAYALEHGYTVVTQDSDFADLAFLLGPPPKVLWLRCGNAPTRHVEALLRRHAPTKLAFGEDTSAAVLELY